MSIIDTSSGYHNLKLDKQLSYLTTFSCPFGRYRYKHLPFRAVPVGDMFHCKIDEIFNDMPNVFAIVDDILVIVLCKAVCFTYVSLYEMSRGKLTVYIYVCFMYCNTQLLIFRFPSLCNS